MADPNPFRQRADELLKQAAATANLNERSRLVGQAARLHMMSLDDDEVDDEAGLEDGED